MQQKLNLVNRDRNILEDYSELTAVSHPMWVLDPYVLFTLIFPVPTQDISRHGYVTSNRLRYAYD